MRAHFRHLHFSSFLMIWRTPQSIGFWPLQLLSKHSRIHRDSNSQCGSSFGSVKVYSLTLACTPGSMRLDSQASFLARDLASLCLGREPKPKVVTIQFDYPVVLNMYKMICPNWQGSFFYTYHFFIFFLLKNLVGKTMNCNNEPCGYVSSSSYYSFTNGRRA
jgi:hypothetical protein